MGDSIIEQSDEEQDPREEFLVEYQEETQIEIQDIQTEAGMPQHTANKNMCKHTQDSQTFLATPTKGMAYIHGTATKMTFCMDNAQHPLILDSSAHCSIVAKDHLDNHFPNWEKKLLPIKAKKNSKCIRKMTSIGKIIKEIIIPHRKGNIRLNPEFVVFEDAHIQGFLLGTDYQRIYGIDIYNSKIKHITVEGQFSTNLTSKQKLSLLNILRKNRPEFSIGEEPLGKIRGHDIELYLDVERPYPPILGRTPYPESLETRKKIEKHINELLDMDFIMKIGHNEIVEIPTPVLISWHDRKFGLCGDFRALNKYTKSDRYPIPRILHSLDKLPKAKYITKIPLPTDDGQNIRRLEGSIHDDIIISSETWEDHVQYIERVLSKCTPINLQISLKKCNFGQQELLALGHKVSVLILAMDQNKVVEVLQKPVPKNIKEMQSFLEFTSYYRSHIKTFAHITSSTYKLCSKDVVFEITKEKRDEYQRIKHEITNAPVLLCPDFELPFNLYIDAACSQGLGASPHQRQIVDGEPREGVIYYISRKLKDSEA
ncbi:hypothetical protein O181_020477 [Austropuccinia psidii MF-1]|uniref:Reverse transcriptase/retrotransposon-derived protein RNase H-like domain-containing protein n=1 Tax=Austropuccinia psidii MF-1 TaxID=1389203 RepID=A0A9Q3GVC9_9BASI|nr:hypothetical protein [Austropuccinia psidii MF-1]